MFTFSKTDDLPFYGSVPQYVDYWDLNGPIVSAVNYGEAYLAAADDGGIFNFSQLGFQGSLGQEGSPHPIVSIGAAY